MIRIQTEKQGVVYVNPRHIISIEVRKAWKSVEGCGYVASVDMENGVTYNSVPQKTKALAEIEQKDIAELAS